MCSSCAPQASASLPARVVLPDPAGPSMAITVTLPQRGPTFRTCARTPSTVATSILLRELWALCDGLASRMQLLGDPRRCGAAGGVTCGDRTRLAEDRAGPRGEVWRDLREVGVGEVPD